MKIVSVVGNKNTGKTSLSVKIIKELKNRGYKVASIKHSHHKMDFDREGTDTYKHKEAGAETIMGAGGRFFFNIEKKMSLDRLLFLVKFIDEPDFLVIEGFKSYKYPKIATSPEVVDNHTIKSVDAFSLTDEDIVELVDLAEKKGHDIINTLYTNQCGYNDGEDIAKAIVNEKIEYDDKDTDVYLSIDENVIGLNLFVNNFIKHGIIGMLKSLKLKKFGVKKFEKIELLINNKKDQSEE
ncbi:molybdopterin-guanine dinucleotide biosynthesis protein B [Methanobrevibacter curvatus]|uniref:Molybdopterin-guanine dinucleotide biosynthesis adapter protein n=1 Tax=Methanobrevibacter curvatus TaxID=49547 RepID=A0A166BIZ0_9EURY|nr:molybdopterin-guanine dinucleotide biosynthesis protein B [Methanobrevibacter curvatus]KZX13422.1 molybdopterin-guanine dinucleotide biosynthesis adapter protein [Methanobrevibacter curvatus]